MGTYFKILNKKTGSETLIKAPAGSQKLYDEIEDIVDMAPVPSTGIPYAIEVDSWGELASVNESFTAPDFDVECISEERYDVLRKYV